MEPGFIWGVLGAAFAAQALLMDYASVVGVGSAYYDRSSTPEDNGVADFYEIFGR